MRIPLQHWLMAIRPRTLPASVAPVLLGTGMAVGDGVKHWPSALFALVGALWLQIGTNLANDYFDFKKGVDTKERKGPVRVTQSGLIPAELVKIGFVCAFTLAALCAVPLVMRAGWPILVIAVVSILSGVFYAGGPRPLSHLGLGEAFVLIFFGPVAVAGTYYVQSFELNLAVVLMGLGCGLLSTAILAVNNLRDIETDRRSGKRTLAVRMGRSWARGEYLFCILGAGAIPPIVHVLTEERPWTLVASVIVFLALPLVGKVYREGKPEELNAVLAQTGQLLLIYTIIFSLAWVL